MTDWNNLFKIRIRNFDDSFNLHEITKLVVLRNIYLKYKKKINYQEIYTEYEFKGKIADVFHLNKLTNTKIAYECQSMISPKWIKETNQAYDKLEIEWVLIDLNKISKNIDQMNKQVRELIV